MPEIAIKDFNPSAVQVIDKNDYFKIKYIGKHTFLNLLVYVPHIETNYDVESDSVHIVITDLKSAKLLDELDTHLSHIVPKYRCFSERLGEKLRISFTNNRVVNEFHKRSQTWVYLRFKCIRKIMGEYNQVLVYIV